MDQEKMGKLIAKCRKEKELTQEELGNIFNISAQSVSKWEKGKSAPDISILPELCNVLGISLEEFFQIKKMEDNFNNNSQKSNEKMLVDGVKFYEKRAKKKYSKRIIGIVFCSMLLIIAILLLYFFNNYNRIKIYSMYSENDELVFNGKIIFNPDKKIIMINNIEHNDEFVGTADEKKAKKLMIVIKVRDSIILEYGDLDINGDETLQTVNEFLDNIQVEYYERNYNQSGIKVADLTNIHLEIRFINEKGELEKLDYKLSTKKDFENSNLFYK